MKKVDLIIGECAQLLTSASAFAPKKGAAMRELEVISNGAIALEDEKIVAVGTTSDIRAEYQSDNFISAQGRVVAPAFVDCHTHIVFGGERLDEFELKIKGAEYLEILANGGGIISTVRQTRQTATEKLIAQTSERLVKMLALGTATAEIKTGYGLSTEAELKMLDVIFELKKTHCVEILPTFLAAHAVPPEFKDKTNEYVELICREMLPQVREKYLVPLRARDADAPFFVDVFCERNAFDLEQSRKVLQTAKDLGFELKAHVDEFTNLGGARMAIELGATSVDHLDATSDAEIELLAASDTIGVVTPTVNFNFGAKDFADARKLIDKGCAVAVSTDFNPGSAPCPSLPLAMAIACRYQKILPAEAFHATTINAAFAVGLGKKTGSLEIGKQADINVFHTNDYRQIIYEFGGNMIEKVFKKGKICAGETNL